MTPEQQAVGRFVGAARLRHERSARLGGHRSVLLSIWVAWEDARDSLAVEIAEDLVHEYVHLREDDLAAYKVAVLRMERARKRYLDRDHSRRSETAASA